MDRRAFLKWMMGVLPSLALRWERFPVEPGSQAGEPGAPSALIILFDAFSARHASLYGYPRETTPNLAEFAQGATVYHRNYSAGNFTNPGTASLLTGTYPWTHRTLHLSESVASSVAGKSIFQAFAAGGYHRVGYSHNLQVTGLLYDFRHDLEALMMPRELCLFDNQLSDALFFDDYNAAIWRERLFRGAGILQSLPTSALLMYLSRRIWFARLGNLEREYRDSFPRGLPTLFGQVFILEDAIDWLIGNLRRMPRPFLVYFHLLPPHAPYNTRSDFVGLFNDDWKPLRKEPHFFSGGHSDEALNVLRLAYDEYIAYVDAEFGRLSRSLLQSGLLDSTYLVLTSDHGEMFERGIWQHHTPTVYEPVVRVPLLISQPGQKQRLDVYAPTSGVDLLPTLCYATGLPIPDWCEGQVMPPFADQPMTQQRSLYVVEAKENRKHGPLTKATVGIIKGRYKLVHYFGYPGYEDEYELYDVVNDPEEMDNLYRSQGEPARGLQAELQQKIQEVNQPYVARM